MAYRLLKTMLFSSIFVLALGCWKIAGTAMAEGPSFDCSKASGSIEELICKDKELSSLDHKLAGIYTEALKIATSKHPPVLKAEQRGWIKGRNECWKSNDPRYCTESAYRLRIAELQARYRLVLANGPIWYFCNGDPRDEVVVTFFQTKPPTLVAERGDQVSLMYLQPSGSGSKYQGRNESFWEHQGEATIVWGYGSPEMICSKRPSAAQLASNVGAADPPLPLADLPVVDMQRVESAEYEAASDFAAGGNAPIDIVLKIVGAFDGSTQHIIQENEGKEAPSVSRITVLRDGLMDDSVRGVRWDIALEKTADNVWKIMEVWRSWRCWRGEKTNMFTSNLCP